MTLDALRGRGAFRCGCGARIKVLLPEHRGDTCVARVRGLRCESKPETGDPVPLCKSHVREMKVAQGLIRPTEIDDYVMRLAAAEWSYVDENTTKEDYLAELAVRVARESEERRREMLERLPQGKWIPKPSVVYYIQFGDRIKIGTTINLARRLAELPHDEVLATESGGAGVERSRHEQFERYRIMGEWFEMGADLLDHINELRREQYVKDGVSEKFRRYVARPA